jgi:hypothetical protein
MPSAAGIIMATGAMTAINGMVQDQTGSLNIPPTAMIDNIPWRVIPATAIAAGIFFGIEQVNASVAKGLATLAFFTAFTYMKPLASNTWQTDSGKSNPLGTLLKMTGIDPLGGGTLR